MRIKQWSVTILAFLITFSALVAHAEDSLSTAEIDPRIPRFTLERPNWGFSHGISLRALGDASQVGDVVLNDHPVWGVNFQADYQPKWFQVLGVLGLGLSYNVYYPNPYTDILSSPAGLMSVGAQVRYQLRFFREQWVVPYAGFSFEYVRYAIPEGVGYASLTAPFFGGMLLLNIFEPSQAGEFYSAHGVLRSYLFGEMKMLSGNSADVSFSGTALYSGIRLEL